MTHFVRIGIQDQHQAIPLLHGDTQAFLQASLVGSGDNHFVDHHLYTVHLVTVEFHPVENLFQLAIDAYIQIAFLTHLLEQFLIMPLTVTNQRSQQIGFLSAVMFEDQVKDLLLRIFYHLLAAQVRIGLSRPGIKQTEEVVHLGSGTDSRAGVFVRRFLFDGDNRTQACDLIHIGTFHIPEEVTRISRECLHVTSLSFRENRIESQRRLSATAHPGYHGEFVSRYLYVYIL